MSAGQTLVLRDFSTCLIGYWSSHCFENRYSAVLCLLVIQLRRNLLPLIALPNGKSAICLALAIVVLALSTVGAKACVRSSGSALRFNPDRFLSASVAFKGHIIAAKSKGAVRTYAVEQTYKGPHRSEWVVIAPYGYFWTVSLVNGELKRSSELPASDNSFIIGIREFGTSEYDQNLRKSYPQTVRADAKHIVGGGDNWCFPPLIAEFTPELGAKMATAAGQLDKARPNSAAVSRWSTQIERSWGGPIISPTLDGFTPQPLARISFHKRVLKSFKALEKLNPARGARRDSAHGKPKLLGRANIATDELITPGVLCTSSRSFRENTHYVLLADQQELGRSNLEAFDDYAKQYNRTILGLKTASSIRQQCVLKP